MKPQRRSKQHLFAFFLAILFVHGSCDYQKSPQQNVVSYPAHLPIDTTYLTEVFLTDFDKKTASQIKTKDFVKERFYADFFKEIETQSTSKEDLDIVYENLKDVDFISFQINLTEKLKAQLFHIDGFIADNKYYFYLLTDDKISPKSYMFWDVTIEDDSLLLSSPPKIELQDFDKDGKEEILVRERHHNGSGNSFIKKRYFSYDSDLNLIPLDI